MSFLFDKVKDAVHDVEHKLKHGSQSNASDNTHHQQVESQDEQEDTTPSQHKGHHTHKHVHHTSVCTDGDTHHDHRFQSFAPQRTGNDCKWYVDGASYFYAVSVALASARSSIWILDWWLSPELYLRRPPAHNEEFRLDRMLFDAAERGVQVNIIVYKEVTQALTLSSAHTKHWLEQNDRTGNIKVFRHPDHLPDKQTLASSFWSSIKESGMSAAKLGQLPGDFIKGVYGMNEDTILYWAHHEKLCLVDGQTAFMGGLDMCFGRWDTNSHPIADAHPGDLDQIVFPGQDYNNARIMDFQDVSHFKDNKLDRAYNSRMGWSDVSISLSGPIVEDLRAHFAQRWNFIYFEKYDVREDKRYHPIDFRPSRDGIIGHPYQPAEDGEGVQGEGQYNHFRQRMHEQYQSARGKIMDESDQLRDRMYSYDQQRAQRYPSRPHGGVQVQLMRSCCKWSHGVPLEHSIANAYIETIKNSKHFVYMENQFFITATSDEQKPVRNKVGAAIVERIIRAARNGEDYHMIINIPAIPGFAGDLKADESLGTRAIMEFQYNSINRGGHSIMEKIAQAGIDPMKYIRFYNLRNYDRINTSTAMQQVEAEAGVSYDDARRGHDERFAHTVSSSHYGEEYQSPTSGVSAYEKYQQAAQEIHGTNPTDEMASGRWDSVSDCYMLHGPDIRTVPWSGDAQSELDAFVSEELYIHSKLLIADDRVVICGSANMNDRSQLGSHDSEIAVLIEDSREVDSAMAGRPWQATRFAASLRRQIFRKHLGLLAPQAFSEQNFGPVNGHDANLYDWDSVQDRLVRDPLSESFSALWKGTAATNTQAFRKVFHPVPDDGVTDWSEYDEFFERYFKVPKEEKEEGEGGKKPSEWKWGHVVSEALEGGTAEEKLGAVKEELSRVRGCLVEMPLLFLKGEDIAKEGLGLNALTVEVYT